MQTQIARSLASLAALTALALWSVATAAPPAPITIDGSASGRPMPHFWEQMYGSGRAILALRDDYRRDLTIVREVTDFRYVRFHNIFADEVGIYGIDKAGHPYDNYSYVDQIYDGLLERGIRPFVELSFMPQDLAADRNDLMGFWYRPIRSEPKTYTAWRDFIQRFAQHLVDRYGIEEVSQWYFEVWNEPNIGFWGGMPHKATYYELYKQAALGLKAVNPRLRVGGPSTAQAAWVGDFLTKMHQDGVPVDFASSHIYANDTARDIFGTKEQIPRDQMVCRSVRKVHEEIQASPMPKVPFILSEFNASYANEPDVTDTVYMGPWLADTIRQCDGLVDQMAYWSFSDVFEEQGVVKTPFYGGFGLVAERDIPKPALNAFALLHRLGDVRLPVEDDAVLATRRPDGSLVLAVWNYAPPNGSGPTYHGPLANPPAPRHFSLDFSGVSASAPVTIRRVDENHGNVIATYDRMGRPATPSRAQIAELKAAAALAAPETGTLTGRRLELDVPAHGLVVLEIAH
ncbi:MAG: glycosyl hydrolase family 39 [Pseudomonadota bacterium]